MDIFAENFFEVTAEGAVGDHLARAEASPCQHLDGSTDISTKDGEYDRYREISPDRVKELPKRLSSLGMPKSNQVKIR
jgi:hypothetical protein